MSTAPSGYQTPRTNWQAADVPLPADFNRIEGNIQAVEEGSRTLDPAQAPASNTGTLRQLLDWFANRIKAITGGTNWYDAPVATLANLLSLINGHIGRTDNPHSVTAAQVGAAAAVHTHDDRYYTESEADGRYAAKSNPTITGALSINDANTKLLEGSGNAVKIQTDSGYVEIGPQNTTYAHIYTDRGSFYLNKDVLINGNKVWHAGNDGVGSGLDADTVDGLQASAFARVPTRISIPADTTTSIAASGTLTKTINLGASVTSGKVFLIGGWAGALVFVTTNANDAVSISNPTNGGATFFQRSDGYLSAGAGSVYATFGDYIFLQDAYISGSTLYLVFKNGDTNPRTLSLTGGFIEI